MVSIGGQPSWTTVSDIRTKTDIRENIPGLSFIEKLRPVSYHYSVDAENKAMGITKKMSDDAGKYEIEKMQFSGFVAQEVDKTAAEIGYDFSGVDKTNNLWGLRYSDFVVPMVKAIQELSQKNSEKDRLISNLQKQVDELREMMKK